MPFSYSLKKIKKALFLHAILLNSAFSWVFLSLSPLPFVSLLSSDICKASSDNHFDFLVSFSLNGFHYCLPYNIKNLSQ